MPFRIRVKKRKHFRLKLFFKKNNYSTVQYSNSSHTFTKKTIYLLDNAVVAVAVAVAVVVATVAVAVAVAEAILLLDSVQNHDGTFFTNGWIFSKQT